MTGIVKSVLHDATPSWNGYNYQGKVGLYVCLANILREAQDGINLPAFDVFLDQHHIEYEWIEDFSIKKNDDYLSLHQVKHKAKNKFSDHVEAIATILYRKNNVLSDTDIFKYFKFNSKKEGDTAKSKTKIKSEIATHKLVNNNGVPSSNWKLQVLSVDIEYRKNLTKCFYDFELLSQKAFATSITYFHTADQVNHPTDDICNINGIPSHFVQTLTHPRSLSCKQIFLSFDNPTTYKLALSDDDLNIELEQHIGELLKLLHDGETYSEADVKLYKTALCTLISQNLVKRHQHITDKSDQHLSYLQRIKPSITFQEIVSELKNSYRVQDVRYWNLVCRENFETAYQEQLNELYNNIRESVSNDDVDEYRQYVIRLESVRINIIEQYFPDDCINFLRQIYPHKTLISNDRQFYEAISEPQKIKSVFLDFIQQIKKSSGKLTLNCPNNFSIYQPSCININLTDERRRKIEIETIKKGLADNNGNQRFVHKNVDYIVVDSTDTNDVISTGLEKITEVDAYDSLSSTAKKSDKFTEEKEVFLMNRVRALREING